MQVGKDRVKGYFLAGFHPASILCLTTTFSLHSVPSCLLCPLTFANGFAVTAVSDRRLSIKCSRPRSAKADQEPQDHLDRPSAFVQRVLTCLVTSFSHLPFGQGKLEGSIIQGASALYLVQIITIPASAVDHHGPLQHEEYPHIW